MKKNVSKTILFSSIFIFTILISLWIYNNNKSSLFKPNKEKIWLQTQWFNGPQFMGIYMAEHKGYFEKENIELKIIEGGYTVNPFETIRSGRADIAIATGDQVLIKKAEGKNYKAIGTVFNKSMACFMVKGDSIKHFTDIIGKKAAVYKNFDTENILLSMLYKKDIDKSKVEIVQAGNLEAFFKDEIDFFPSYRFNEPITAETRNVPVKLFLPEEHGIYFYSDTFFCKEEFFIENNDLLKRFLRATSKGWAYSKSHPMESVDLLIEKFNTLTSQNRDKLKKELDIILKHIGAGNNNTPLKMEKKIWDEMELMLYQIGKIKKTGNINSLCDFTLIKEDE